MHQDHAGCEREDSSKGVQRTLISCTEHTEILADAAKIQFERISKYYTDLLDPKHNKVTAENLCNCFMEVIMDPKEIQFGALRKKILNGEETDEDSFARLRRLNPEIFLK